uniref:MYND-type domain-containing protein n=1 Tax=Astatotilapia calliptera TaxID=8154 RepID=A0AAX7T2N6_ASTCA
MSSAEVVLGFLEDAEPWRLRSPQFPSKVGGKPAWLSQRGLPSLPGLECEICRLPMVFLLQVYAPISGQDRSFHRTLFLFCCKTPECYTRNDSRCMKVFRNQLQRRNEFYPYDPPAEDEPPCDAEEGQSVLPVSGVKLCWVCGCPGNKACSRCHTVTYCGKHHQTLHWKQSHKKECCSQEGSPVTPSPLLFPETELVTEPEEEEKDVKEAEGEQEEEDGGGIITQRSVDCPALAESLCRSFTRSPRVVLGSLLTVLMIILTPRDEILRGAPDRGRLSVVLYVFHFLMIAPTVDFFTPSCLPIVDSLFPVWCRSTILFLAS